MAEITQVGNLLESWLHVSNGYETYLYGIVVLIIAVAIISLAFFTIKKLAFNLITSYLCIFLLKEFMGIAIIPDALLLALMAFLGPPALLLVIFL